MDKPRINIRQIRDLAGQYAAVELEGCIQDELEKGSNTCLAIQDQSVGVSILSMAGFVRARMEQDDVSVSQALRILGQRMRGLTEESSRPGCNEFN